MELNRIKKYTAAGLPFLQAQLLRQIYLDITKNKTTDLKTLSEISDYPQESKILKNAIDSLITKNFIYGSLQEGFSISEEKFDFFQKVVKELDHNGKVYS